MLRQSVILITLCAILSTILVTQAMDVTLYPAHPGMTQEEFLQKLKKDPININKAELKDLAVINGVGFKKAKAIIEYRDKNGSFKSTKDLIKVKGIGSKMLKKLEKYLTV